MQEIASLFKLQKTPNFHDETLHLVGGKPQKNNKEKTVPTPEDIEFIDLQLDWELETYCGYKKIE